MQHIAYVAGRGLSCQFKDLWAEFDSVGQLLLNPPGREGSQIVLSLALRLAGCRSQPAIPLSMPHFTDVFNEKF
jgi:hypothetical protein